MMSVRLKSFLAAVLCVLLLPNLFSCEKQPETGGSSREEQKKPWFSSDTAEQEETPGLLTHRYRMVPLRTEEAEFSNGDVTYTPFTTCEITGNGIVHHVWYEPDGPADSIYRTDTYDPDGSLLSSIGCESPKRYGWLSTDGVFFVNSDFVNNRYRILELQDTEGTVLCESTGYELSYPLQYWHIGKYFLVTDGNLQVYAFDENLNLLCRGELPIDNMDITDIREYDEESVLIHCSLREELRKYGGFADLQCYILYFPETGHGRKLLYPPAATKTASEAHERLFLLSEDNSMTMSVYFRAQDGVYLQGEAEDTLIFHFENSDLNPERLQLLDVLPENRFLGRYTDPLTEQTQTVLLVPDEDMVSPAIPLTVSAVGVTRLGGYGMLTDAVSVFNASQDKYRVSLHAYGLENNAFTSETNETFSALERDIVGGSFSDVYIFGLNPYDVNAAALYDVLTEKNFFADLSETAAENGILSSITEAYRIHGSVTSLPLSLSYTALYTDHPELWKREPFDLACLSAINGQLGESGLLLPSEWSYRHLREVGLCSFYDKETKTARYDSAEFLSYLSCLDTIQSKETAGIAAFSYLSEADRTKRLQNGTLAFDMLEAAGPGALAQFCWYTQGENAALCGFPALDEGMYIRGDLAVSVMKNSPVPDGAEAFLAFLFSDRVQTSGAMGTLLGLPVTESALSAVFPVGYNYYTLRPDCGLEWQFTTDTPMTDPDRRAYYSEELLITAEQRDAFLDYVKKAPLHRMGGDKTILSIVEEELSAADAGVRSRAEAAKIIQNRVMLYLNE